MEDTWSVSQFLQVTNQILDNAYPGVKVFGEVSQLKLWRDRLAFFDLKDDEAVVNCMVPVTALDGIEEGMEVTVIAQPKITAKGRFSLNVRAILPKGEGAIKKQFDLLKTKLEKEGLFAPERKRALPYPPKSIGLITAENSAAYVDFTKIINARWGDLEIDTADVQVQGEPAVGQITSAINYFNQLPQTPDVIVICRGGGSAEDLLAFNDESLTRAVAGSRIPSVVAVGHESDTSLAELAADVRASTPSNAAEVLVPDKTEYLQRLKVIEQNLTKNLTHKLADKLADLNQVKINLDKLVQNLIDNERQSLRQKHQIIKLLNPENALKNGYALIKKSGIPIGVNTKIHRGDEVEVDTYTQSLIATIKSVKRRQNA